MYRMLILASVLFCSAGASAQSAPLSPSKYDWSGLANSVTSTDKTAYDRAYDIYRWLAENISYDTTYSIYTADGTYENRRGVCQGYSELFCRIAEAVGLRADIVTGKTKDADGSIPDMGHAWLFVYTDGNSGILVDPTWGAGGVSDGVFKRNPTDSWFHVDPAWMIFSHLPDNEMYQLMPEKISYQSFLEMPRYEPSLSRYGYNGREVLASALKGDAPQTPRLYTSSIDANAVSINFPKEKTLREGQDYEFVVKRKPGANFVVSNGDCVEKEWMVSGDITGVRFMPSAGGTLNVGVLNENGGWTVMAEYDVAEPTASDIAALEARYPLRSPALSGLPNFNRNMIEHYGIDVFALLKEVKAGGVKELPKFYGPNKCRLRKAPWNGVLRAGAGYTFAVEPGYETRLAIINGDDWYMENSVDYSNGSLVVTIPSAKPGKLKLSLRNENNPESYSTILEYRVE